MIAKAVGTSCLSPWGKWWKHIFMKDAGILSGRNINLSPLLREVWIHIEGFVVMLRNQRSGRGNCALWCWHRGLCNHVFFLSSGSLLGSTRSGTRGRLFTFYSYCCHPDLTLSLEASGDSCLQLRTSQETPPSEVRVPDLRGLSPKP